MWGCRFLIFIGFEWQISRPPAESSHGKDEREEVDEEKKTHGKVVSAGIFMLAAFLTFYDSALAV